MNKKRKIMGSNAGLLRILLIYFNCFFCSCFVPAANRYQTSHNEVLNTHPDSSFAFSSTANKCSIGEYGRQKHRISLAQSTKLYSSSNDNENEGGYSRQVRLREEVESPFRKVRFFFYVSIAGGAATSLAVSLARIAAASSGVNTDLMEESVINAAIDVVGLVAIAFFYRNDLNAQESRLQRASKGAELAKLAVRVSTRLIDPLLNDASQMDSSRKTKNLPLSSLRRGRGIEKRVVIAVGGQEKIQEVLNEADELSDSLEFNDLLVVPVVLPQCQPPAVDESDDSSVLPDCVALPVSNNNWKLVIDDESSKAKDQGVDVEKEGFCVILKKNGRVGQRTKGIFLSKMVGEVNERRELGLDVSNI